MQIQIPKIKEVKACKEGYHVEYRRYKKSYRPECRKDKIIKSSKLMARCGVRGDGDSTVTGDKKLDARIVKALKNTTDWCSGELADAFCPKHYNIPKEVMPSLKGDINKRGDDTRRFLDFLVERNVHIEEDFVEACQLKATQKNIFLDSIASKLDVLEDVNYNLDDPKASWIVTPIIVSNDNYILDGHHRWAAVMAADFLDGIDKPMKMHVKRTSIPIIPLINRYVEFCSFEDVECDKEEKLPQLCMAAKDARLGGDKGVEVGSVSKTCEELIERYESSI